MAPVHALKSLGGSVPVRKSDQTDVNRLRAETALQRLLAAYQASGGPVETDFRRLVSWLPDRARGVHYLHAYPAKLLMHIPHLFVSSEMFSRRDELVFDPFCGSGTVLVEAVIAGRRAAGCDVNPLAQLITQVKTTPLDSAELNAAARRLRARLDRAPESAPIPEVVNRDYWYGPAAMRALGRIRHAVETTRNEMHRALFRVCLSTCARRASRADPRISVPVRLRRNPYRKSHWLHAKTSCLLRPRRSADVISDFQGIVSTATERVGTLAVTGAQYGAHVFLADARAESSLFGANGVRPESVTLIVTSPPYAGAQKYIRASSLSLGWLGFGSVPQLRQYERSSIGREKYAANEYRTLTRTGLPGADDAIDRISARDRLRAHLISTYLVEMRDAVRNMHRALRPGGHLVMVVGNNHICGMPFATHEHICALAREAGFETTLQLVDSIKGRGLMTKRNREATLISREWVLVFRRPIR